MMTLVYRTFAIVILSKILDPLTWLQWDFKSRYGFFCSFPFQWYQFHENWTRGCWDMTWYSNSL